MYDPLGGEAYVPKVVKEAAVSDWLQGQSNKCRLMLLDFCSVLSKIYCFDVEVGHILT